MSEEGQSRERARRARATMRGRQGKRRQEQEGWVEAGASAHTTSPDQVGRKVWGDRRQARECTHNKAKVWWNRRGRRERTHNKPRFGVSGSVHTTTSPRLVDQARQRVHTRSGAAASTTSQGLVEHKTEQARVHHQGWRNRRACTHDKAKVCRTGVGSYQAVNTAPRGVNSVLSCSRSCLVATSRGTYQLAAP